MVNQSVNEFYTRFLFKIDALLQDVAFPLYITATLFNNLSPNVRELFISEGFQVPQGHQLKTITRENRDSFWYEMQQWRQKRIA